MTLTLNKPSYVGIFISNVSKVLIYKSITITLNINTVITQDYYSLTFIVWCMKLKPKMFMNISVRINKSLILAIIQLSQI